MTKTGTDAWHARIESCVLHEELLLVMSAYLGEWRPQEINRLPIRLTGPVLSIDHLHQRAIELIHAEVNFRGSTADWTLLGELTVVITAAAVRARSIDVMARQAQSLEDRIQGTNAKAPG